MARLQGGTVRLRLQWESLEELVGSALRQAAPVLAGAAVRVDLPADLPLVEMDALLVERVLVNLLENAARYGAAPIELRAWTGPEALWFSVRDHGPGLPAALHGRESLLFEKFTRGVAESPVPGVGLGLAICKAAVEAHGGRIEALQAPGGGAEFRVRLPRRAAPAAPA
jgi:two-component system sensor histidine kinase KdpD